MSASRPAQGLCLLVLGSMLAGCGFHLRGTQSEPLLFDGIHVEATADLSDLTRIIERELESAGAVVAASTEAEVTLQLIDERSRSRPITSSGSGSAGQYEIQLDIEFALLSRGELLIAPATLSSRRIYSFDRGSLVGNSEEERLLTIEMRRELAARVIQRLNAVAGGRGS